METDKGIPILDGKSDDESKTKLSGTIATNALATMTSSLVDMEKKEGVSSSDMMEKCVWPILYEAARRFDTIANGDLDVPDGGFEYVVG